MSTSQISDRDGFNTFIDVRWGGNLNGTSLEDALQEFRDYQRELESAQVQIAAALQSSADGESNPMDDARLGALFQRRDAELLREGIED
jgi:hypothetical protein